MRTSLSSGPRPEPVVCGNNLVALGAYDVMRSIKKCCKRALRLRHLLSI